MQLGRLWLTDFRSTARPSWRFAPGLTAVVGANGQGKTNLLEAIGYLATLSSFRGAPADALIRHGADQARHPGRGHPRRPRAADRGRAQPHRAQPGPGQPQRADAGPATCSAPCGSSVFAPDDLALVKGGPAERRRWLDDTLVALHPRNDALRTDLDRVLRQRNALLKQSGGRLTPDIESTLDVWDAKLAPPARPSPTARAELIDRLRPVLAEAYDASPRHRAGGGGRAATIGHYVAPWRAGGLAAALAEAARDDLRRGVSTVGPHRDDVDLVDRRPAGPHPRLAGRAAVAGLGAAAGLPHRRHRRRREPADPAPRRRVLRARPRPLRRPARQPARPARPC